MTAYKSNNTKSLFSSAEIDDGSSTGFFFVQNEADVEPAKEILKASGQSFLAQSFVKGQSVIITHSEDKREGALKKLSALEGGNYEPIKPEKTSFLNFLRKNGWKLRGGSSVIGQSMTLFSAFKSVSKVDADAGRLTPKFDPATGAFATLNLAANFVNYVFGGQKEKDTKGLEKFDEIIAEEVNRYVPGGAKKTTSGEQKKLGYMTPEELAENKKSISTLGLLKQNSVRLGEVGLRTIGSLCMVFNYRKVLPALGMLAKGDFKQAWQTARVQDPGTFMAGLGMVAGKIMGLAAQTYDPNDPPKTYMQEIRQKVLWITSSFTEMIAQSSVAYDRYKNKRLVLGGKVYNDITGIAGNIILTVPPYPTRLVLPYGKKVLDTNEVQARLLDELPELPADKVAEVAARVTARMVEHIGDGGATFSELYTDILGKLKKFHQITPQSVQPQENVETVGSNFVGKVVRNATKPTAKGNVIDTIINKYPSADAATLAMR
jgi:hypothetical protein